MIYFIVFIAGVCSFFCVLAVASAILLHAASSDEERVKMVEEINNGNNGWTAGYYPRWGGLPIGASKSLCGLKADYKQKIKASLVVFFLL